MRKRLITPCYALFFLLRANIGGIEYNSNFNHGNYDNGGQKSSKWFNIIWNSTFKLEMGSALVIKGQVGLGTGGNRGQHYHHQPDLVHLGHFSHNSQIGYFLVHTLSNYQPILVQCRVCFKIVLARARGNAMPGPLPPWNLFFEKICFLVLHFSGFFNPFCSFCHLPHKTCWRWIFFLNSVIDFFVWCASVIVSDQTAIMGGTLKRRRGVLISSNLVSTSSPTQSSY